MASYSLPHLHVAGNHYEVSFKIGKEFKARIHEYFRINEDIYEKILPFIATEKGKLICQQYYEVVDKLYPWYIDEVRGLSDGSELPFDQVFAINLRVELMHITRDKQESCHLINAGDFEEQIQECSDFFLINQEHGVMVHNEDSSRHIYHTGYLATCKIRGKDYGNGLRAPDEEFTCHCYPAQVPGNAYAFNTSGFIFTVNALVPKQIALSRLPRQFMTRAMLSCKTLLEIEDLFLNVPIAYGVNVNVGYFGDQPRLKTRLARNEFENDLLDSQSINQASILEHETPVILNYELAPSVLAPKRNRLSKHCLVSHEAHSRLAADQSGKEFDLSMFSANQYFHFNHYERIKMEECVINSSWNRGKRSIEYLNEIGAIKNLQELLVLASDSKNEEYPIYRNIATSKIHPIATAVFDLKARVLNIFIDKPTENEVFFKIIMDLKKS